MKRPASSIVIAIGILLSRISGLVREAFIRGRLDIGSSGDAYTAALRVPNLLQNLLGEGVLSASFIPVYSGLVDDDRARAARLANSVAVLLIAISTPIVILGVVAAEPITKVLAFGLSGERLQLTSDLVQIMTPGIGMLVLSAWSLGVLNSHRRFGLPYAAPVIWNVTQIAVVVAAGTGTIGRDLAIAAAWGVTIGSVLQFAIQLPALRRANPDLGRGLAFGTAEFRDTLRRLGPVVLGRGSAQVSAFIDLGLATVLAAGALSAIGIASLLYLLPISLFAMSIAAAELPEMSRLATDPFAIRARLGRALEQVSFFMAFTTVVYVIAGRRVLGAVFSVVPGSELSADGIVLAGLVLATYSLGLLALGASRIMQNTFYALGDAATPARVAVVRYAISAVVSVVVMLQMDRLLIYDATIQGFENLLAPLRPLEAAIRNNDDLPLRAGAAGLAFGATVGAWFEVVALRRRLVRRLGSDTVTSRRWRKLVLPTLIATLVMLLITPLTASQSDVVAAALTVIPAGVVYVGLAAFQRVDIARRLLRLGHATNDTSH